MRVRRLALAAAPLLALALALAACSGGAATPEAASTPAPTATATPEAASTPAPTAVPTPEAASTPAPTAAATPETVSPAPTATPAETGAGSAPVPGTASLAACSNGIAIPAPYITDGLVRDCALLLDGKDALRGTTPLNWNARVSMAEWEGVSFGIQGSSDGVYGSGPLRVTGLALRDKGLRGVIPPQLGYLTALTALDLAGNGLTGAIPSELANLAALEQFLAGGNRLTGEIPAGLGLSRELHTLDLSGNRLTGTIPDLSRLTMLRRLDLRGNGLVGGIPAWLGDARQLAVLRLDGNRLRGPVPRGIGRLPLLADVTLAGNALTGCVPSAFEDASGDAAGLGLPWCLRYDRLDATGEVASAGEWAILGGNGEVLATWEQLRSEAATLRVHQTDAGGNSWASEFGAVAVNDLFEWRLADDCWVRYRVAGAPVAPLGASGRWEFPVEWMTYAATGSGCTGAVGAMATLSADESAPTVILASGIASPVRHGDFLVFPEEWAGSIEDSVVHEPPPLPAAAGGASGSSASALLGFAESLVEARRLRYWHDPALPAGWTFSSAEERIFDDRPGGYCADYRSPEGYIGVSVCAYYKIYRPNHHRAYYLNGSMVSEPRVIDGYPAIVRYQPRGGKRGVKVWIFDPKTGVEYSAEGFDHTLSGSNDAAVIAIARSLLPPRDGAP